jgi:hypothetical protein
VFSVADRERVKDRLLALANADPRVAAAAFVGGSAATEDRFSDVDITFGVDGDLEAVLIEFTQLLSDEFDAAALCDLVRGPAIYRVFLLPGCLQVDLSFAPAAEFGARGPRFRLLWGEVTEQPHVQQPDAADLLGWAVHHLVRARYCIERGRLWESEYWISGARDNALAVLCLEHGVDALYAHGIRLLPPEVVAPFERTLVRELARDELLRTHVATVELVRPYVSERVAERLRELEEV